MENDLRLALCGRLYFATCLLEGGADRRGIDRAKVKSRQHFVDVCSSYISVASVDLCVQHITKTNLNASVHHRLCQSLCSHLCRNDSEQNEKRCTYLLELHE